jgi:hypothetical protein
LQGFYINDHHALILHLIADKWQDFLHVKCPCHQQSNIIPMIMHARTFSRQSASNLSVKIADEKCRMHATQFMLFFFFASRKSIIDSPRINTTSDTLQSCIHQ